MIEFGRARPGDAEQLARVSERAFHSDIHCGAPGVGGPPGYKSADWQKRMMRAGQYYRITLDGQIVGGFIIFPKEPRCYELGRIFVDPDVQNQGIGHERLSTYGGPTLWLKSGRWERPSGTYARGTFMPRSALSRWGAMGTEAFFLSGASRRHPFLASENE